VEWNSTQSPAVTFGSHSTSANTEISGEVPSLVRALLLDGALSYDGSPLEEAKDRASP
jgi:hypothetical protein